MFKQINKRLILKVILLIIILFFSCIFIVLKNVNKTDKINEKENIINKLNILPTNTIDYLILNETIPENIEEIEEIFYDGWITAKKLNIRSEPSMRSESLGYLLFNDKISYTEENSDWVKIKYQDMDAYIYKDYIAEQESQYTTYSVPINRGFKSYMDYRTLTNKSSWQYKLQKIYATTGNYGIRMVNGRYCIAVGSYFKTSIGQYLDLVLENGTVIPCIMADLKADIHTDAANIATLPNGCLSEFVVSTESLSEDVRLHGNTSYCTEDWKSPVIEVRVYNKNIFN